jgi:hypothetical protein
VALAPQLISYVRSIKLRRTVPRVFKNSGRNGIHLPKAWPRLKESGMQTQALNAQGSVT